LVAGGSDGAKATDMQLLQGQSSSRDITLGAIARFGVWGLVCGVWCLGFGV